MSLSALVLTVGRSDLGSVRARLKQDPRLEVGVPQKGFLPVVSYAADLREARRIYEELQHVAGVCDVQLVSWIDEDSCEPCEAGPDVQHLAEEALA